MDIIEQDRERYRKFFGERDKQKDHWVYSCCSLCYAACAIKVRVLDGKPVAVEGVPETDRGAQGGLCAKGVTAIMDLNSPNRVLYPVKRTNPNKGLYEDPQWQRISWEEALTTITEKLDEARKKDPRSIFYGASPSANGGKAGGFLTFFPALGSPSKASGGPGVMCGASAHHFGALQYATWDIIPDYRYCNYVLRCGGNEGWGGGRNASASIRLAAAARERGLRMKVMDPQGFTVASKGEEWIPILPATDIAVFLAIANLIVNEIGVYDQEYIRHKTNGPYLLGPDRLYVREEQTGKPLLFDEADGKAKTYDDPTLKQPALEGEYTVSGVKCLPVFALIKEHLRQYKPDWASQISTVPAATIKRLAKELVEEAKIGSFIEIDGVKVPYRPACVVGYKGVQTHSNSFHQYSALHLINILLGNQDVCGGLLGSGTARSLGYPGTGGFTFEPFRGLDGLMVAGAWPNAHPAWPPKKMPETYSGAVIDFKDIFVHHSCGNIYPYASDWDELRQKAGLKIEPGVFATYGANAVMNITRPADVEKFLKKFPFAFALQPFHDETTEGFCDIVLPESHFLETLDVSSAFGTVFNFAIGMDKWGVHIRLPAAEPRGESRNLRDVMSDLADRLGVRDEYDESWNSYYTFRRARQAGKNLEIPPIVEPGERLTNIELSDRTMKYHFGQDRGLEWFRDHGFITWEKKPEECYWRWFVDARVPMFFEEVEANRHEIKKRASKIGFDLDWDQFTGLTSYFPSIIYTELPPESEYDLLLVSQRDSLMCQRFSADNAFINEAAQINPYTHNITMNAETGKRKGIKEGDTICLENHWGDKVSGKVRLSQLIHPGVLAAVGLGSWARGKTISREKGINTNALTRHDQHHFCAVSGAAEPTARVKAYKI